jgi:4-alpha-glucanotransferase
MTPAAPPPRLVELAHAYGVATEYWDWLGQHVTVSDAAIRAVLTADQQKVFDKNLAEMPPMGRRP